VDFSKVTEVLPSFQPQWTFTQGISELAEDMRTIGLSTEDFEGPRFVRLERVNQLRALGRLDDFLYLDR
jgi:hypothetical protein